MGDIDLSCQGIDRQLMKRNVFLLALCQALMLTGTSLMFTTSALVGVRLADSPALATLPLSLQFIGMMLSSFASSMLMKRIGRKSGFSTGLVLALAGAALCASAIYHGSFIGFCIGSVLLGIFNGVGQYYRFTAAEVAPPEFRARAISYVLAGGIVAAFIGPNLARFTRDLIPGSDFSGSYMSLLVVYALSIILVAMTRIPPPDEAERSSGGRPLLRIMAQPVFFVAVLSALVGYGVMNLVMTATPLAMQGCGFDFGQTAHVIQWHVVGMFLPSFFTGRLIERFGVLNIMIAGGVFLVLCIGINLHGITYTHFLTALISLGFGWNFLFIGGTTLLTEVYSPAEKAKTQGINDFIVSTTVACTALSSGYLNFRFGWEVINQAALPAVAIAMAAVFWLMVRRRATAF